MIPKFFCNSMSQVKKRNIPKMSQLSFEGLPVVSNKLFSSLKVSKTLTRDLLKNHIENLSLENIENVSLKQDNENDLIEEQVLLLSIDSDSNQIIARNPRDEIVEVPASEPISKTKWKTRSSRLIVCLPV
jgi:hypothetical protein